MRSSSQPFFFYSDGISYGLTIYSRIIGSFSRISISIRGKDLQRDREWRATRDSTGSVRELECSRGRGKKF